ncbi:hypothetical protein APUTEX25_003953, partial [Auxenochlorella protothecoides]
SAAEKANASAHVKEAEQAQGTPAGQEYVAICAATKDAGPDVREWADYHLRLGVARIYLFDTDNPEPVEPDIADFINQGRVEYYYLPRVTPITVPLMQIKLYDLCLRHASPLHAFIAFIDVDEFLVMASAERARGLPGLLKEFEQHGALAVNWRLLGPGGHAIQPGGGVLQNFLACTPVQYPENRHIKSIVNTKFVRGTSSDPHHFEYAAGASAVTLAGEQVTEAMSATVSGDRMMLYHYATKSMSQYSGKMVKGSGMGNRKGAEFLTRIDGASTEICTDALTSCKELGMEACANVTLPVGTA